MSSRTRTTSPASPARVTIRDVARAAGVSLGTASRALNRSGPVSDAALQAVERAAKALAYAPDPIAQSLRTGTSGVVGLLVSDLANPLYARIITAVEIRLQREGYAMVVGNTHNSKAQEELMVDLFRRRRVDGLILGPCEAERSEYLDQVSRDLAVVAMDRDFGEHGSGVHVDHFRGAYEACRYLLDLGHTRIALMTSDAALRPGRERIHGYRAALQERGVAVDQALVRSSRSAMDFSFSDALALLSAKDRPTAFICLGTRILSGVLQATRQSGHRVPLDVSLICVGDGDLPQLYSPAITAVSWDLEAVGTAAAEILLRAIGDHEAGADTKAAAGQEVRLATQMVLRESCAPPPAAGA
ncbi:LacI family transcriptional regulator [Cupriavidus phytorum]|uniref:LacI family transcriptional regulator n=2 Tax=Cupriavidus TaxID=106589 RepID=A0A375CNE5_9BURK|nr:LacI family DNA-binding transcriptional regulator [Cupriavidus alkaliphilus]PZX26093.1 LacI family transcriptional regulator [Cupriavidus alkaliphilus]SOY76183.1 LacI family transcriptional regulator [Cupriavidus taiwanensis]